MRTYQGFLLLAGLGVVTTGCALLSKFSGGDAQRLVAEAQKLKEMDKKCNQLGKAGLDPKDMERLSDNVAYRFVGIKGGLLAPDTNSHLKSLPPETKQKLAELATYINRVCKTVDLQSPRAELPNEVVILDSDSVNAYSTPSYRLFTIGYLKLMKWEDQLAFGGCGHERGHVDSDHMPKSYRDHNVRECHKAFGTELVGAVADVGPVREGMQQMLSTATGSLPVNAAGALNQQGKLLLNKATEGVAKIIETGYNKDQEDEADRLGFDYALRAGYDPETMWGLFDVVPKTDTFMANHPAPQDRKKALQAYFRSLNPSAKENKGGFVAFPKWPFANRKGRPIGHEFDVLKNWKAAHVPRPS